jgi:hypothetical protein
MSQTVRYEDTDKGQTHQQGYQPEKNCRLN